MNLCTCMRKGNLLNNTRSFLATKETFEKRHFEAVKNPSRENCMLMARAAFALSLSKVRLLRQTDMHGHLLLSANKQVAIMRSALMSYMNHDANVQQTELIFK